MGERVALSPAGKKTERLPYLDGMRGLAALFVVIHHAFCMAYPIGLGIWPEGWIGLVFGWTIYGHFGVTVFIALAGYSLTLGLVKHNGNLPGGFAGYMKRRAWRILPPYWAALVLTIVLSVTIIGQPTGTHWDQSLPPSPIRWMVDALLLQDIFPVRSAAYTFWSIAVEWHIYLLLPLILFVKRRGSWGQAVGVGAGISALALVASRFIPRVGPVGLESLWPTYYLVFACAVGACVVVRTRPGTAQRLLWKAAAGAFAVAVAVICLSNPYEWVWANYYWIDLLAGASVICLIAGMASGGSPRAAGAMSWAPLASIFHEAGFLMVQG